MFYCLFMRWQHMLADSEGEEPTARLPQFSENAVLRRFNTPEFRGMTFYEVKARTIINHVSGDRFGFNWTINPYRGCSHACGYCFARPTHTYLDFDAGTDFETKIVVKINAAVLLHKELRKPRWEGDLIAMGTNTDPYQRAEGHYKLMRGILKELNAVGNPYSILTKGTLIQRDIDLLTEGASRGLVHTNVSVGTVDQTVWRASEPGTPNPRKRLELVGKLNDAGIPCGVLMAPILPGISDSPEQLRETVKACADAGATHISPIVLHLRPGVKEEFMTWLEDAYPDLVDDYTAMYRRSNAPKDVTSPITKTVANFKRKYMDYPEIPKTKATEAGRQEEQMSFELGTLAKKAPRLSRM